MTIGCRIIRHIYCEYVVSSGARYRDPDKNITTLVV